MRRTVLNVGICCFIFLFFSSTSIYSQFSVSKGMTPAELVKEILGNGVEKIENVKYNGQPATNTAAWGTGTFNDPGARLDGVKKGIVLSSIGVDSIMNHPSYSDSIRTNEDRVPANHKYFDADLGKIVPDPDGGNDHMFEGAVLEFDFVPKGDQMEFSYVFASDEYHYFVCSKYNDVFGFFLSGPGINGPYTNGAINIALIPGTQTPVAINTVNKGVKGGWPDNDVDRYCDNGNGLKNKQYFVDNENGQVLDDMLFNGFTKKLKAKASVQCGKTYHIKLAITDINDFHWNSGVFLESGSFNVTGVTKADATATLNNVGCSPYLLTTENQSDVPNHFWDFGDGSTSTEVNPAHIYITPGTYHVVYIANDPAKCIPSDTLEWDIEVLPAKVFKGDFKKFTANECETLDSLLARFEFDGEGADSLVWDFGDGTIESGSDYKKSHVYYVEGKYTVKIKAFDLKCNRDTAVTLMIDYKKPGLLYAKAGVIQDTLGCGTFDFDFFNNSINGPGTTHLWRFGDGNESDKFLPTHQYAAPGNYKITYIVKNSRFCNGIDSISFNVTLLNSEDLSANLLVPQVPSCNLIDSINLDFEVEIKSFDNVKWEFGDNSNPVFDKLKVSHTYKGYGDYKGTVTLTDTGCMVDSVIPFTILFREPEKILLRAGANNDTIGCGVYELSFYNNTEKNGTTHHWDFGDGEESNEYEPEHHYLNPGTYTVTYTANNPIYCIPEDSLKFEVTVLNSYPMSAELKVPEIPTCNFIDSLEAELEVFGKSFDRVKWEFGDGTNPVYDMLTVTHTYNGYGRYVGQVTVTDTACNKDSVINFTIDFPEPTKTVVNVGPLDSMLACAPFTAEFFNNSNALKHFWDFGDGDTSIVANPVHTYKDTGEFVVKYVGINENFCFKSDSTSFVVRVLRVKPFEASIDFKGLNPCGIDDYDFNLLANYTGESTDSVVWDFGDGSPLFIATGDEVYNSVSHTYLEQGKYILKVHAFDLICGLDSTIIVPFTFVRNSDEKQVHAPNIFTPNGDRINDEFKLFYPDRQSYDIYADLLQYEIDIFNRWGNKIFSTGLIDLKAGDEVKHWRGEITGEESTDGIYFYVVKFRIQCDEDYVTKYRVLKGHVSVSR